MTVPSALPTTLPDARGSEFGALAKLIRETGLMKRRPGYYALRFGIVLGLFALSWVLFFALGRSWWQLLLAAAMGVMFTQIAFLGHDVGHRQVFKSKRNARIAGWLLGNLGIGLGYGWWVDKHTRHHNNPNHLDEDPDVNIGAVLWSPEQAANRRGRIGRWFGARQAYWFFPILLLEGLSLQVDSFLSLTGSAVKHKRVEATLLVVHSVVYLAVLFLFLPPLMAVAFVAVHLGVFGVYMGCSFAPNHKGMPLLDDDDDERADYLRKQVETSRNVRGGMVVNYLLGGLNYQIEHHLFPSMPMVNLPKARLLIKDYCERLGVSYCEEGLITSYRQVLGYLHEIGEPLRTTKPAR